MNTGGFPLVPFRTSTSTRKQRPLRCKWNACEGLILHLNGEKYSGITEVAINPSVPLLGGMLGRRVVFSEVAHLDLTATHDVCCMLARYHYTIIRKQV